MAYFEDDGRLVSSASTVGFLTTSNYVMTTNASEFHSGQIALMEDSSNGKPSSRVTLQDYVFRQLGAPVLEINVADEQFDDLLDTSQYFYERHFDGVEKVFLKYQLTKKILKEVEQEVVH